jgi:hypothetical protein
MRAWLVVLVLLAGCASAPAGLPRAGAVSEGDRADPASALRRLGAADSLTLEGARALFGGADVERREGAGAILTYRTANCAVTLVFAADGAGALRLGAMEARARDQRAAPPPLEQCVNEAMARRATS